jgi:hypothetical protein
VGPFVIVCALDDVVAHNNMRARQKAAHLDGIFLPKAAGFSKGYVRQERFSGRCVVDYTNNYV